MAMTTPCIAQCLGQDFLAQTLGRDYLHLPEALTAPGTLISFDTLNDLIARHRLAPPRLRLSADGEALPQHRYAVPVTTRRSTVWHRIHPTELHARLAEGASLVIDAIDELHEPVGDLAAGLEAWLRTHIQVNAYASWTDREGFGTHWDDHDVIVLQIAGSKRWTIYGPTRQQPMYHDVATPGPPPNKPMAELVLQEGELLYLPRGWWHAVTADQGTHSLHLTCGLTPHTGADLITWASGHLRASTTVRTDLPLHAPADEQTAYLAALRKELDALLEDPHLLHQYVAARDAEDLGRLRPSLPHLDTVPTDPGLQIRLTTARARTTTVTMDGESVVRLTAAGNEIDLDPAAAPLLDTLIAAPSWVSLSELAATAGLTLGEVTLVAQELITAQAATLKNKTAP
ncbi:cupin domain-containing protein [Streptomyces sp. NPDC005776]|uniref:cupin domain-containing protein n=1 Tax=Streptomyces sp. NPDC005776 TaxID=3154676 RepID=UPI0033C25F6F